MNKLLLIISLFFFSFAQAKAICMNDDDLMDYAIVTYMETSWTAMDACMEKIPNYDYTIYEKFVVQFKDLTHTSDKYLNAYFKKQYGNQWKQKKKDYLEVIVNDYKINVIEKMDMQDLCKRLNNSSQKYIEKGQEAFLIDIGSMAGQIRKEIPKC